MLTLKPHNEPEPKAVASARALLDAAPHHPDADEIGQALDILGHAVARLNELAARCCDGAVRAAMAGEYGATECLSDALGDLGHAVECWAERPENSPEYIRAADRADAAREAAL